MTYNNRVISEVLPSAMHKKKICVFIARYALSGVPLAQIRLARAFSRRGYHVDLILGYVSPEYRLPEINGVNVLLLGTPRIRQAFFPLVKYLRRHQPELIFSAEDHVNILTLLALIATNSKSMISASSRVTPYDTYSSMPLTKRWFLKQLMRMVMWRANVLTCVSKDMVDQYRTIFRDAPHIDVYNIVDDQDMRQKMKEPLAHDWLDDKSTPVCVAAGQLGHWKGFDTLLKSFEILLRKRNVRLILLGDGPQRNYLEALANELGISNNVRLEGNVNNPLSYFVRSDIFILSSLVEGLPNVLVEAMMCGCTPVSTDCPTGPRELLQEGKYGYLVPMRDPEAMAAAIEQALDGPIPKALLAEAVRPFEESVVIDRHFEVLGLCPKSSI